MPSRIERWLRPSAALPAAALLFLTLGAAVRASAGHDPGDAVWLVGLVVTGAPVVWRTLRGLLAGRFAADIVATLAIVTAIVIREPLAGLIIVLMQTGGEALERYAEGRASDAVRELEAAAPRWAHRAEGGRIIDIAAEEIRVNDLVLVRPGELVPCDGDVVDGRSHVGVATLTGEPMPLTAAPGTHVMSGSVNGEGPLTVRATATARLSQYARIVELVRSAQATRSPLQRLADRYAVWFTPVTLAACVVAYLLSGDPARVLAVLVVATPCPLILATPVAIIGGINRAARRQIIVRHGGALEQLAHVTTAVFDKTGTVTVGLPRVAGVLPADGYTASDVLRLAGSVERGSSHLLARTLVQSAEARGIAFPVAEHVAETPGRGVQGEVEGGRVAIGSWRFVIERNPAAEQELARLEAMGSGLRAFAGFDGHALGVIEYADQVRPGLVRFFEDLQEAGVARTILLSGDHVGNVRRVAERLGIREVRGDLLPEDKVKVVRELAATGKVVMVGDGTNDAPALSAATVGVALAGHSGGITAEAADVILLVDDPTRLLEAIRISRRTIAVAQQSIWVGLGLSGAAMVLAAAGLIIPTIGAVLQEGIDIAVILNALRTGAPPRVVSSRGPGSSAEPVPILEQKSPEPREAAVV
jgi:heavy metal translocating P-type ATPase